MFKITAMEKQFILQNRIAATTLDDVMKAGLGNFVKTYIELRKNGNVKDAKEVKKNIDKEIKKHKLNSDDVYFYYGDPDRR
jgi:hypothetical protein